MRISIEDVRRMAGLARLELDPVAEEPLRQQLESILGYVRRLHAAGGAEPSTASAGLATIGDLREDVPEEPVPRDEAVKNSPDSAHGQFRVPRVLD